MDHAWQSALLQTVDSFGIARVWDAQTGHRSACAQNRDFLIQGHE
jgi:hypothetical protein